jgi:pSer/pThr/pTyr-binding forkhead associated (FHA) protein
LRDSLVSRSHAKLVFSGGLWRLKDLNSRNGTWLSILNYARLAAQESSDGLRLIPGMVFAASRYWFRVLDA